MTTKLCIDTHVGETKRCAKIEIGSEPATVRDFQKALAQLSSGKLFSDSPVDAIYYESQEAF
jgi:hypothetical protein